jgi:hypothetical protein
LPSRVRKNEDKVAIVGVRRKNKNNRFDEVCIHCRLGSVKFLVSLPSDEFTVARLKSEIARRLLCEFGARYAKSLVGQKIPIAEIIKESDCARGNPKFWDLF